MIPWTDKGNSMKEKTDAKLWQLAEGSKKDKKSRDAVIQLRYEILQLLLQDPLLTSIEIGEKLYASKSTIKYHLRSMERAGVIMTRGGGSRRKKMIRWEQKEPTVEETKRQEKRKTYLKLVEITKKSTIRWQDVAKIRVNILELIAKNPTITPQEIGVILGFTTATIKRHLEELKVYGIIGEDGNIIYGENEK